jgi:hypothetical protein
MKMHHAVAAAALSLLGTAALAATSTVSTTLDVASIQPGLFGFTGGVLGNTNFAPGVNVVLAEGDTLDFTVDFVGNQTLTLNNFSTLWLFSFADLVSDVTGTGTLSLLDTTGSALFTSNLKTDTEGEVHFGQFFGSSDFASLPSSVTFGGLRYVGTVDDYIEPTVTERTYASPGLLFVADSFTTNVPEPSTWALMLAGMGAVSTLARRRRQA